jgi:hypothetical protein
MGRVRLTASGTTTARRRPVRRWWADLAGSAALLSVVVVIALWLHNGGIRAFSAPGGPAASSGRLTGLVASDLLLLQVLLMARIPWVERPRPGDPSRRWPGPARILAARPIRDDQ